MYVEIEKSEYGELFEGYDELVELGFDFEKNSARDFIDCLIYLYMNKLDANHEK